MAEFSYEVVASYAEKDNLKVQSIAFNGREPKFDIRHWMVRDGKEVMGKGVTLTMEELLWLATELPKVVQSMGGAPKEDKTMSVSEKIKKIVKQANQKTEFDIAYEQAFAKKNDPKEAEAVEEDNYGMKDYLGYIVDSAKDIYPGEKGIHGVIVNGESTYATNREVIARANEVVELDTVEDNKKVREIIDTMEKMADGMKSISGKDVLAFVKATAKLDDDKAHYYTFGEGKPVVNAMHLANALKAIKGQVLYSPNGVTLVTGTEGAVVILPAKVDSKQKKAGLLK